MNTVSDNLKQATYQLEQVGIETARLDSLVLLGDVTGKDRAHLLAHPELELAAEQIKKLKSLLDRRAQHEPLAYVRKKSEFYGRNFIISHYVLEPRPESEMMIQLLKSHHSQHSFKTIIDVGTGSGALAITAQLELPKTTVFGIDIDPNCLAVASQNAQKYDLSIDFKLGNLLEPTTNIDIEGPVAILANLPYVPDAYQINKAASHEPRLAIFGGKDGLDLFRQMFEHTAEYSDQAIFVFTESMLAQHTGLANIARAQKFTEIEESDFIQVFSNV